MEDGVCGQLPGFLHVGEILLTKLKHINEFFL